ncbi:hypothetical protein CRG98_013699 [Punica granatum]|uniref:Uncharacterized protein n=1 Tax=Punica granatum TaxID=22663 RepID=A0A2I0KBK2_PUNGR|nr:hypothetical protein CRG98_013699 [Punica granatum]
MEVTRETEKGFTVCFAQLRMSAGVFRAINVKVGTDSRGQTPVQKGSRDVSEGDGPLCRKVVGTDPKGTDPYAEKKVVGTDPKGLQYARGAYRMNNMVQRRLPNGLAGCGAFCSAGLQGAGCFARRFAWCRKKESGRTRRGRTSEQKSSRDGPLCRKVVGTDPKGLQYARGAYRMNNMVQRRLPNGLAGCGAFCSAGLQGAGCFARRFAWCRKKESGRTRRGRTSEQKSSRDGPLCRKVVGTDPYAEK